MPLYVYKCPDCGHELELIRKYSEVDDKVWCPACKREDDLRAPLMDRVSHPGAAIRPAPWF